MHLHESDIPKRGFDEQNNASSFIKIISEWTMSA